MSSPWPWYLPSNMSTVSRPVAWRASRIASTFAVVAESVNCHCGRPQRRASSAATQSASSVGSWNCAPRAACSATARVTGSGAWPQNALVSAMWKSR